MYIFDVNNWKLLSIVKTKEALDLLKYDIANDRLVGIDEDNRLSTIDAKTGKRLTHARMYARTHVRTRACMHDHTAV